MIRKINTEAESRSWTKSRVGARTRFMSRLWSWDGYWSNSWSESKFKSWVWDWALM